jgi:hypothetical protein
MGCHCLLSPPDVLGPHPQRPEWWTDRIDGTLQGCIGTFENPLHHISIGTSLEPSSLTAEIATRDVTSGLGNLRGVVDEDPRLAALFEEYGVVREYVYDYGHGAVKVADVAEDGTLTFL